MRSRSRAMAGVAHAASDMLVYGSGPVQDDPEVYPIFVGSQWSHDSAGVIP